MRKPSSSFQLNNIWNKVWLLSILLITFCVLTGTAAASSVKLTSITLDPEDSTGQTTNAPGAWSTNLGDPLAQIGVKDSTGVFLNQHFGGGSLGEISIPLNPGINTFTIVGSNLPGANFPGNEYYGAVLFFDGVVTPPQIAVSNSNGGTGSFSVQPASTIIMGGANGGLFFDVAPGSSIYTAPDGTKVEVVSYSISTSGTTDEVSWGDNVPDSYPDTIAKLSLKVTPPIKEIISLVNGLDSKLNKGQLNSLIVKVNAATKNLNDGNNNAAINELNAFIKQVNAFITSGILTKDEGQPLIDAANAVINSIQ